MLIKILQHQVIIIISCHCEKTEILTKGPNLPSADGLHISLTAGLTLRNGKTSSDNTKYPPPLPSPLHLFNTCIFMQSLTSSLCYQQNNQSSVGCVISRQPLKI